EKYPPASNRADRAGAFADGAGAAVVGAGAEAGGTALAIGPVIWGSDAAAASETDTGEGGSCSPEVLRWVTTLPSAVRRACTATGIAPAGLAAVAAHHAEPRTITSIGAAIGAPQAKVATDF